MTTLYGYVIAAFLTVAAASGAVGYWLGFGHANDRAELRMATHLAEDQDAASVQLELARQYEQDLAEIQATISEAYERGKKDAEVIGESVVADLSAGRLRMQQRWQGCEAMRVSEAASGSGELDAGARDREESAGRIVRAAAECDAQVRGLQSILRSERDSQKQRRITSGD